VLLRGGDVVAAQPDGSPKRLAEGQEVPSGAVVTAGRDGAVLRTRGRDTWLAGDAAVRVVDGARQELRSGFVMVDARRGPELELATSAAAVTTPVGAVSRVERGALLRVGAYAGEPLRVRAEGRRATVVVGRDHQVQVPAGGLPGRITPLVLTPGDRYERALAAPLVRADEALTDVARRLDAGGRPDVLVRTAFDGDLPDPALPATAPSSERTLAYLLARAAGGGELPARFAWVRALRTDGGSWGVVADLVGAEVSEVAALLDELLAPDSEAVLAAEGVDVAALLGLPGSGPAGPGPPGSPVSPAGSAPAPGPAASSGAAAPAPRSDRPPAQAPAPAPAPAPVPAPVSEPLDAVVDAVRGLQPGPAPAPAPAPTSGELLGLLPGG
jgi:hypothetical protein